jgi:hypothetical protein
MLGALEGALDLHARRPLLCHHAECTCVGSDEAALSLAVSLAAAQEREEAALVLSLIVRADALLPAVDAAGRWGLALERLTQMRAPAEFVLH